MGHNRRHAALATLCVFAVLLAASLFPASGFGAYPAGVWSDSGTDGNGAPGETQVGPTTTVEIGTTTESTASTGTVTTAEETTDGTTTATTTERTTTAASSASHNDGGFGGDGLGTFVFLFGLLALGLVGFGFVRGTLATVSAGGLIPFTLTIGGVPIGNLIGGLPERTMTFIVGFSSSMPQLLDDVANLTSEVGNGLAVVLSGTGSALGKIASAGLGGLGAAFTAVPRALSGFSGVGSIFSGMSMPSFGRSSTSRDRSRSDSSPPEPEPEESQPPTVEEAWETMADRVFVRNRRARTPSEFARAALERGYPDDAVRKLTKVFQEVRYGRRSRDDRTPAARSALDRIQRYWDGEDE